MNSADIRIGATYTDASDPHRHATIRNFRTSADGTPGVAYDVTYTDHRGRYGWGGSASSIDVFLQTFTR